MNAPTKFLVIATIYLTKKQQELGYIPDYCIHELVKRFGLSGDVFREIRDIVQDEQSHFQENDAFCETVAKIEAMKRKPLMDFGDALKKVYDMAEQSLKEQGDSCDQEQNQIALDTIGEYIGEHFTDLPWEVE